MTWSTWTATASRTSSPANASGRTAAPATRTAIGRAVLYWFKLVRGADKIAWTSIPYLIDNDSGVGTQVVAGDINGDGLPDVVVGNKKGTFIHLQEKKSVTKEEWEKAQPKPLNTTSRNQ